jgi:prepilin-type N-terminal cleavage/methylation domain-containing protein
LRPGAGPKRRGFTLVEVIVVLVILAILAAIAIPALTGYIDKSRWTDVKLRYRTQLTAVQTLMTLDMTDNGLTNIGYATSYPNIKGVFGQKWYYADNQGFFYQNFTDYGLEEYTKLTGDTVSLTPEAGVMKMFQAATSLSGEVIAYRYIYNPYPDTGVALRIMYVKDINSTDPVTTYLRTDAAIMQGFGDPTMTSGINIYSGGVKVN